MIDMLVLDTDVASELMRPEPTPEVADWHKQNRSQRMYLTAVTEAELRFGIAILPAGKRRNSLARIINSWFEQEFMHRILPFDSAAAKAYAIITADLKMRGLPIGDADGRIAAICRSRDATLVTRNVRHFIRTGIDFVNPWDVPGINQFPSNGNNHRFVPPLATNSNWMHDQTHAN